jgi:hypothetical protein
MNRQAFPTARKVLWLWWGLRGKHWNSSKIKYVLYLVDAFAKLRRATVRLVMSVRLTVRPSVQMEQLRFNWTDLYEM